MQKNYTFSVYYVNNRNDVYVKEGEKFFEYKYQIKDNDVVLTLKK